MVRVSFGAYNTIEDVDALVEMLHRITRNEYKGEYHQNAENGEYVPAGYSDSLADYFSLAVNSVLGEGVRGTGDIWPSSYPSLLESRI